MRLTFLPAATALSLLMVTAAGAGKLGDTVIPRRDAGPSAKEMSLAVFPHLPHRIRFKCYVCHESIFKMKAGADAITMDAIMEGKACGACHNGKTAFHVSFDTCGRCHL